MGGTLKQIRGLDLAAKHVLKDQFSPCRIPTLEEFVDECMKLDLKMIIDLKPLGSTDKTCELITDLYKKKPKLYTSAMTSSFHPHLLYAIRQKDSRICCSMAWRPSYFAYKNYSGVSKEMARRFSSPLQHLPLTFLTVFHGFRRPSCIRPCKYCSYGIWCGVLTAI